ncbi:MAG: Hsp20/alpha crystallin family protein [Spirosomataceae bacterium]
MCNKTAYSRNWNNHFANKLGSHSERPFGEHPFKKMWKQNMHGALNTPPVNVRELDDKYELHLFAAGYVKSDFSIALMDQTLKISAETKEVSTDGWKRHEYAPQGFIRQFELNEKVDKTAISAAYENGVLILSLPKLEGFETERKDIVVE